MARDPIFEGERDPDVWLDLARTWRKEGRHADSLRAHRYYHANALVRAPHYSGVRLSFALGDWAALARKYPPALKALRQTRERAAAAAVGPPPDWKMLNEALAIDSALEDSDASYQLISDIEAIMPGELPGLHNQHVTKVLRSRGEYRRCLAWMGDPDQQFNRAAGQFVQLGGLTGRGADPKYAGPLFRRQVGELVETLVGGGRTSTAKRLIIAAEKLDPHPAYAQMLDKARQIVQRKRPRS